MADINYPLKTVTDRLRSARTVLWAIDTQWPLAEAILDKTETEESTANLSGSVATLRGRLSRAQTKLADAHEALLDERAEDADARDERDDAFLDLFRELGAVRDTFGGVFGRSKLRALGFTRRLPNTAEALSSRKRSLSNRGEVGGLFR